MLFLDLCDEPPRDPLPATIAGRGLRAGDDGRRHVQALRAPVFVVGTLTTLYRSEAHGVEPSLDGAAGDVPGTVLELDLVGVRGVEISTSPGSGGGFLS